MPETTIPAPPGFNELSKAEQVRYLQALWDEISEGPADLPVRESHLRLVKQRLKQHRDNPSLRHSAFEVLDRLGNQSSETVYLLEFDAALGSGSV